MGDRRKVRDEDKERYTHTEHDERSRKLRLSRLERGKCELRKTSKFLQYSQFVEVFELEKELTKSLSQRKFL